MISYSRTFIRFHTFVSNARALFRSVMLRLVSKVRGGIQTFPDWSPRARTANGTVLPLGSVVSLFRESV
jgi:hypothetical protein